MKIINKLTSFSIKCLLPLAGMLCATLATSVSTHGHEAIEASAKSVASPQAVCPEYLRVKARKLHSDSIIDLCELTQGKAVLIVNTASNCGFTSQFNALEALHKKYQAQGLVVIGFPSDDFFQEEKDEAKTAAVCFINYGVSFTMLATSPVRGRDANSVFQYLTEKSASPKWNFYKYLVSPDGQSVQQFNSRVKPDGKVLNHAIVQLLTNLNPSKSVGLKSHVSN
jgi:glutathione peroxidase